eukprot:2296895-Pleurochrysis_carterae.AAC.1
MIRLVRRDTFGARSPRRPRARRQHCGEREWLGLDSLRSRAYYLRPVASWHLSPSVTSSPPVRASERAVRGC